MTTCVARSLGGDCTAAATHAVSSVCEKGHVREGQLCGQHVWSIERGENPGCRECLDAGDGHVPLQDFTLVALPDPNCKDCGCPQSRHEAICRQCGRCKRYVPPLTSEPNRRHVDEDLDGT